MGKALDQETGRILAVKELWVVPGNDTDAHLKATLQNEIDICKDLKHERIVSYFGHDCIKNCLYIYLEYMPGGSMATVLAQFGSLEESLLVVYTREIAEGMEYLHTRDPPVVHRDV